MVKFRDGNGKYWHIKKSRQRKKKLLGLFLFPLVIILVSLNLILFISLNNQSQSIISQARKFENQRSEALSPRSVLGVNQNIQNQKSEELPKKVILDIDLIKQIYPLSCEVASLQMALSYYDINKTQDDLLEELGISEPFTKQIAEDRVIWGNPDEAFVGDVKGWFTGKGDNGEESILDGTGWGVNNGPIAQLAKKYRPDSEEIDGGSLNQIKQALNDDYPVIWWHVRDDAFKENIEYQTLDGQNYNIFQHHANLLIGYEVNIEGKIEYIFNDPYFDEFRLEESEMLKWWAKFNNEMVIVK